jgi:hypothetical protein
MQKKCSNAPTSLSASRKIAMTEVHFSLFIKWSIVVGMSVWTNSSHVPVENLKKSFTFYAIYLYHITAPLYIVNVIVAIKIYNNGKQVFI